MSGKLTTLLTVSVMTLASTLMAQAAPSITVDVASGRVLAHEEAFQRWYPASLTKMMTAYVAFRALQSGQVTLDTPVRVSANAAKEPPSKMGYKPGSSLTLNDALTIMLVKSANDISVAIAETIGGSEPRFVQMMNEEARRIGMRDSNFANPNGLHDPKNYTTARDLAVLAVQLRREFPQYAHYFGVEALDTGNGQKPQPNYNLLIGRYDGADGMKTGFVCASGFNLASSATRNGRTILAVVLGADRQEARADKAANLMEAGFRNRDGSAPTLASLQPYGSNNNQAPNLRAQICSKEAMADRWDGRDSEGRLKLTSPYIQAMTRDPRAVRVGLLASAPELKGGQIHISQVPVPMPRPARSQTTKAAAVN